jgi:hypothetical protein
MAARNVCFWRQSGRASGRSRVFVYPRHCSCARSPAPIEAAIALSILFVAAEIIYGQQGNLTYIITAKRIISGLVLEYLNGLGLVIARRYESALPATTNFLMILPAQEVWRHGQAAAVGIKGS